jgi:hypothetical protein
MHTTTPAPSRAQNDDSATLSRSSPPPPLLRAEGEATTPRPPLRVPTTLPRSLYVLTMPPRLPHVSGITAALFPQRKDFQCASSPLPPPLCARGKAITPPPPPLRVSTTSPRFPVRAKCAPTVPECTCNTPAALLHPERQHHRFGAFPACYRCPYVPRAKPPHCRRLCTHP